MQLGHTAKMLYDIMYDDNIFNITRNYNTSLEKFKDIDYTDDKIISIKQEFDDAYKSFIKKDLLQRHNDAFYVHNREMDIATPIRYLSTFNKPYYTIMSHYEDSCDRCGGIILSGPTTGGLCPKCKEDIYPKTISNYNLDVIVDIGLINSIEEKHVSKFELSYDKEDDLSEITYKAGFTEASASLMADIITDDGGSRNVIFGDNTLLSDMNESDVIRAKAIMSQDGSGQDFIKRVKKDRETYDEELRKDYIKISQEELANISLLTKKINNMDIL